MKAERRCFIFFVDGLGLGRSCPDNPVSRARMPFLRKVLGGALTVELLEGRDVLVRENAVLGAADATLGVDGEPQSATGQASLLSGLNVARLVRGHLRGRPNAIISAVLKRHNLFIEVRSLGMSPAFLNAFRPKSLEEIRKETYRPSVTTQVAMAAGLPLHTFEDMLQGKAVYHDITHWFLRKGGHGVPERTPQCAGKIAARALDGHQVCLFEYFLTDLAGHRRDMEAALTCLEHIDAFLGSLYSNLYGIGWVVLLVSDHGNVEDLSTPSHTLAPVPVLALAGDKAAASVIIGSVRSLVDVTPAILRYLCGGGSRAGFLR